MPRIGNCFLVVDLSSNFPEVAWKENILLLLVFLVHVLPQFVSYKSNIFISSISIFISTLNVSIFDHQIFIQPVYFYISFTSILFCDFETKFSLERPSFSSFSLKLPFLSMPNIFACETFSPAHKFEVGRTRFLAFSFSVEFDFDMDDQFFDLQLQLMQKDLK